ncbi:hypothetical protein MNQ98_12920 [Paenibacillus sp. N3/727]|uniref:hypothetical protein n=1 Tax=Paenibacillus sp. N3/727 TaxID=2925845 RepID=UPI001F537203|nr:hypothetical protein [Paenibacillus sp. N3/727]UNK20854.1 hypothetical protein MNQ98_12920 [Paenibacillus sp. N3/727]
MKTIALWSPLTSGSGTTALAASLPIVLAMEFKVKTLLLHGGAAGERVEQAYSLKKQPLDHSLVTFQDHGMNAVERLAASGRLMPENIRDYTSPLLQDRLDLLAAGREPKLESDDTHGRLMSQVLETAVRGYDVIVADAGNGRANSVDRQILRAADLILIGLNQNIRSLEKFFESDQMQGVFQGKDIGFVIGRYDRHSHCTLQNVKRRFGVKGIFEGIPYCSEFTDAWNMRSVQACIQRGKGGMDRKRESPFYRALRSTGFAAAEQIGLPSSGYSERGA